MVRAKSVIASPLVGGVGVTASSWSSLAYLQRRIKPRIGCLEICVRAWIKKNYREEREGASERVYVRQELDVIYGNAEHLGHFDILDT